MEREPIQAAGNPHEEAGGWRGVRRRLKPLRRAVRNPGATARGNPGVQHEERTRTSERRRWLVALSVAWVVMIAAIVGDLAVVIGGMVAARFALARRSAMTENFIAHDDGRSAG